MAGKPKAQKKNPTKHEDPSFPGLKGPAGGTKTTTQYEELQQDELTALKAIYDADFVEQAAPHSAWKKSEPRFDIRIKPISDDQLGVTLGVIMTATYPKSTPLLTIKDSDGLREATLFKIQKYLEREPGFFAQREEVMINVLVEGIRDILEDAAQARALGLELPSLEEERAAHEAELARQAVEDKEKEEQKLLEKRIEEDKEEERVMVGMVQEEMNRQRVKKMELRRKNRNSHFSPDCSVDDPDDTSRVSFDQPCRLVDETGHDLRFNTVTGRTLFNNGPICSVYIVRPVLSTRTQRPNLALKQADLMTSGKDPTQFKKQLESLEAQLERAKKSRHKNLLQVMEFRIDRLSSTAGPSPDWTVRILMPLAKQGSLNDLLEMAGQIEINKVRGWTRDLLEALNFLHTNGVIHKSIHPSNILLFKDDTGAPIPKLADAGFQKELHDICLSTRAVASMREAKSAYWFPPEIAGAANPNYTQKTDIWDFGVVFLQMVFGLDVPQRNHSPTELKTSLSLSPEFSELVSGFFASDPARRKRAFDLGSHHFLAATSAQVLADGASSSAVLSDSLSTIPPYTGPRLRHGSMNRTAALTSRWAKEWVEEGRLGKGGFGEVVKARNMVDGYVYAVKKIRQREHESLTPVVSEVSVFGRMSHPSVVRYYGAWIEEIIEAFDVDDSRTTSGGHLSEFSQDSGPNIEFTTSHGALDFMSSSRPHIEFGVDSDEDGMTENGDHDEAVEDSDDESDEEDTEEEDSDEDDESESEASRKHVARRASRRASERPLRLPFRKIMYLVMEYCEKRTLRDLIVNNLYEDSEEIWKLFRQTLEGLQHIHGLNIIHRDLKPENIFITVGPDGTNAVKIGDFGLATAGMRAVADKNNGGSPEIDSGDMTRSVGTSTYLAPEVRSGAKGTYSSKCDMYALGIIFFEMCYPSMMGHERAEVFEQLRRSPPTLPDNFRPTEKNPKQIVLSLVDHNPTQRPSATELLKSGLLPVEMESDAMRQFMAGLQDPNNPRYTDYVSALFKRPVDQAKNYTWDLDNVSKGPADLMRMLTTRDALVSIFRRHGAVEVPRSFLYPPSSLYVQHNTVQVVDEHGALLQMPYDLMMGNARVLSKCTPREAVVPRSYSFGTVFRKRPSGGQPQMFGEVHFDVVSADALDLALKEAEALKVLDEIIDGFPALSSSQMCFHVGHSELLGCIFDHCGIEEKSRRAVADTLSKLNVRGVTWQKIKSELRASASVSTTALDELQRFDFRDTASKVAAQLRTVFQKTQHYQRVAPTLAHIKEVTEYCKRLGVRTKVYVTPLWSWNEVFFRGGTMFACLFDKRNREVLAAGGRYDGLIREQRPRMGTTFEDRHAVGFGMNWEQLATVVRTKKPTAGGKGKRAAEEEGFGDQRRCDVLVASFDAGLLRTAGIDVLQKLWAHDISAELARDARSPEELLSRHRDDGHGWVVIVKQDMLKVKTPGRREASDVDVPPSQLIPWLRNEMREREHRAAAAARRIDSSYGRHHHENTGVSTGVGAVAAPGDPYGFQLPAHREQEVRVLMAQTKSKKANRQQLVEQAQAAAARLASGMIASGSVVAIETTDAVMDLIRGTRLSDAEGWRKAEQSVGNAERRYMREIHGILEDMRAERERAGGGGGDEGGGGAGGEGGSDWMGSKPAFVYNFRTGGCIYYDLGA